MKKTYALMLAAVLAVSAMTGCSEEKITYTANVTDVSAASGDWADYFAAETSNAEGFETKLLKDGTIKITDYELNDCTFRIPTPDAEQVPADVYEQYLADIAALKPLKIPAEIDGKVVSQVDLSGSKGIMPVVILPDTIKSFKLNSSTQKVNIPAGYSTISAQNVSFSSAQIKYYKESSSGSMIEEVYIPEGVTKVGDYAFNGCKNLEKAELPSTVNHIGYGAFRGCKNLEEIDLSNVNTVDAWAFSGCNKITDIVIIDGTATISEGAFANTGIVNVNIPASVKDIAKNAFNGCEALVAINVDEGNAKYASVDGVLFTKNMKTLMKYPTNKADATYEIPYGVKTINDHAFSKNQNITTIVVPKGTNTIGFGAFEGCGELVSLTLPSSVTSCDWNASDVFVNAFDNLNPNVWITYGSRGFAKADIDNDNIYFALNHLIYP